MAKYAVPVLVRMTPRQAQRLDEVQSMPRALHSRAAAVRRLIDSLDDSDLAPSATAGSVPPSQPLDPDVATALLAAVQERTEAYRELSNQVRAVGYFLNTLTRLGHQIAGHGSTGAIPIAAVESVGRQFVPLLAAVTRLGAQDREVDRLVERSAS